MKSLIEQKNEQISKLEDLVSNLKQQIEQKNQELKNQLKGYQKQVNTLINLIADRFETNR